MKPFTIKEQNIRIKEIKDFLALCNSIKGNNETYRSPESLVLNTGRPYYINKNSFLVKPGVARQCYRNSFYLMESNPELTYVEGYCHIGILPIEHAWCVDKKGKVIDPTLVIKENDVMNPCGYFGIPFTKEYVYFTALSTKVFGIISYTNRNLFDKKKEQYDIICN